MPRRRDEWLQRIRDVEREQIVARLAIDRFQEAVEREPALLGGLAKFADVRRAAARLDGTYFVRLFAEFETGLRSYWPAARATAPPSRTRDLLDGLAATRRIPPERLAKAHAVREYRNHLVHKRDDPVALVTITEARKRLCIFLSFLPPNW